MNNKSNRVRNEPFATLLIQLSMPTLVAKSMPIATRTPIVSSMSVSIAAPAPVVLVADVRTPATMPELPAAPPSMAVAAPQPITELPPAR